MKEPKRIRLTNNPETKKINLIPLVSNSQYKIEMTDDVSSRNNQNENNRENNSESISELDSM